MNKIIQHGVLQGASRSDAGIMQHKVLQGTAQALQGNTTERCKGQRIALQGIEEHYDAVQLLVGSQLLKDSKHVPQDISQIPKGIYIAARMSNHPCMRLTMKNVMATIIEGN